MPLLLPSWFGRQFPGLLEVEHHLVQLPRGEDELSPVRVYGSYDFISCRRYLENRELSLSNFKRVLGNLVLTLSFRLIYSIKLGDSQSGMWIFHRKLLEEIELKSDGMALFEEIKIETFCRKGFMAGEYPVPYTHKARVGSSKLRPWRDGLGNLIYLIRKRRDLNGR